MFNHWPLNCDSKKWDAKWAYKNMEKSFSLSDADYENYNLPINKCAASRIIYNSGDHSRRF